MNSNMDNKAEFPAVYVDESCVAVRQNKARRLTSAVVKLLLSLVLAGFCMALILQVVNDKKYYDSLLNKYTDLLNEGRVPNAPVYRLTHRAADQGNVSYTYTTTTLTQGTTVTVKTTPAASMSAAPITAGTGSVAISGTAPGCSAAPPSTVTVTVHDSSPASSVFSNLPASASSSLTGTLSSTVSTTRVKTTTVFVTASGLVTATVETLTSTAFSRQTTTEVATAGAFSKGTSSTQSVDAVSGIVPSSSAGFSNTSSIFNMPGYEPSTTASYILSGATGFSGTGPVTSAHISSTSTSDPVGATVVTVSGAEKTHGYTMAMVFAAISVAIFLY